VEPVTDDAVVSLTDRDPSVYSGSDLMDPVIRERALLLLAELGREFPTFRLGQLVCALTSEARVPDSVYDLEDKELIAKAVSWLEYRKANR
jgi:hypothetical protein